MDLLRLLAFDDDDLQVISAHLQDAVVKCEDIAFLPRERRFALCLRRFDWEAGPEEPPRRRLAGLHFENVVAARRRNFDPRSGHAGPLNLLAVTFEPGEAPSGKINLIFSEDRAIQLDVECLEAQMKDLGPMWEAETRPFHLETQSLPARGER